jgi:hypothetical protein
VRVVVRCSGHTRGPRRCSSSSWRGNRSGRTGRRGCYPGYRPYSQFVITGCDYVNCHSELNTPGRPSPVPLWRWWWVVQFKEERRPHPQSSVLRSERRSTRGSCVAGRAHAFAASGGVWESISGTSRRPGAAPLGVRSCVASGCTRMRTDAVFLGVP